MFCDYISRSLSVYTQISIQTSPFLFLKNKATFNFFNSILKVTQNSQILIYELNHTITLSLGLDWDGWSSPKHHLYKTPRDKSEPEVHMLTNIIRYGRVQEQARDIQFQRPRSCEIFHHVVGMWVLASALTFYVTLHQVTSPLWVSFIM